MKNHLRLSKYIIAFSRENNYLIFSCKSCNFYKINKQDFQYLKNFNKPLSELEESEIEAISSLIELGILTTEEQDDNYLSNLEITHDIIRYSPISMGLTLAPTISCNLSCPYCFEQTKPKGIMSLETADKLIDFINNHKDTKNISITWYGGEPLLAFNVIKYLLPKLYSLEDKKIISHSMVTNGTLLTSDKFPLFHKYPLDSIQITLDGKEEVHNTKRFFLNGEGTFSIILNNIEKYCKEFPNTNISIRVNVDNNNSKDYLELAETIKNRFKNKRISVYPGILIANKGCENEQFFTSEDHLKFQKEIWDFNDGGYGYPSLCIKGCTATTINSFVIGPTGEIYKCWEQVGDYNSIVGYISNKSNANNTLFNTYITKGLCFDDPKCQQCSLLPICSGGCPRKRVDNLLGISKNDLCCIYNNNSGKVIEDVLFNYYKKSLS